MTLKQLRVRCRKHGIVEELKFVNEGEEDDEEREVEARFETIQAAQKAEKVCFFLSMYQVCFNDVFCCSFLLVV